MIRKLEAADPRFHRTLFGSLTEYEESRPPLLYYVENGNSVSGYDQLALDYKMAADLLIATERDSGLGNWLAPMVLIVRQTLELALKALLEATVDRVNTFNAKLMFSHDLVGIWAECQRWLDGKGYSFRQDARCETAEWVIENFHAVDPTGDLFRFAHSKHEAFKRKKTYDRAGTNKAVFASYFDSASAFLSHWQGVLVMEWIEDQALAEGMPYTRPIDPDDFPRCKQAKIMGRKQKATADSCNHAKVRCLNQHEYIRKYHCEACRHVMMCACDEANGRRHLAHQLDNGRDLKTQLRVPVTLGFQKNICPECRGEPPVHAPAAAIHGRTSKIKRFYWREIGFDEMERMADWSEEHPEASDQERAAAYRETEALVLESIKAFHAATPKYDFTQPSQADILNQCGVEVVALHVEHSASAQKGAVIVKNGQTISPEAYVAQHYEAAGWSVDPLESRPFHALFGVMMWMLIQDLSDPLGQMAGFGRRDVYEASGEKDIMWTTLPQDFGSEGYAGRRHRAVKKHFKMLADGQDDLLWLFDLWTSGSEDLRQYLWAHRDEDVQRARRLVEILPSETILLILRYLLGWYWERYLGWPDLLAHRGGEVLLLEVKSSSDKLSDEQKRWIVDNAGTLKLPFKVVKLHKLKA